MVSQVPPSVAALDWTARHGDASSGSELPLPDYSNLNASKDLSDSQDAANKQLQLPLVKTLRFIAYSIIVTLMLFSMIAAIGQVTGMLIPGYHLYNVISNSMDGMIDKGSLILTKAVPPDELISGDVITFKSNSDTPITHQIIEIIRSQNGKISFVTKGHSNATADPVPITPDMILGKVVFHVPAAGRVFSFITKYMGIFTVLLMVCVAAYLLFILPHRAKATNLETHTDKFIDDLLLIIDNQMDHDDPRRRRRLY